MATLYTPINHHVRNFTSSFSLLPIIPRILYFHTSHFKDFIFKKIKKSMASFKLPLILLVSWLLTTTVMATNLSKIKPGEDIAARLQVLEGENGGGEASMPVCWNALFELKSCTNEIILFFFNGESYLGKDCCKAIRIITYNCWPSMLSSVGFTAEEVDILRGYCGTPSPESAVEFHV
ncbi:egg cell-secreted protein 1.2-like [Lycium ferocissimum]|uniref:egg cell-secreted protein 1.2-like n=1 Tax=Lycium ferocissimum TaxID=112874 RepID=UPI002815DA4B|nr:egg cell-secreted protein 1.2-like [Lycium ferocissimum]